MAKKFVHIKNFYGPSFCPCSSFKKSRKPFLYIFSIIQNFLISQKWIWYQHMNKSQKSPFNHWKIYNLPNFWANFEVSSHYSRISTTLFMLIIVAAFWVFLLCAKRGLSSQSFNWQKNVIITFGARIYTFQRYFM